MFDSEFYAAERSVDEMTGEATFQEFSSSSTAPVAGREAESDANGLWKKGIVAGGTLQESCGNQYNGYSNPMIISNTSGLKHGLLNNQLC